MENKTKKKLLTSTNIPLTLRPQRWVGVGRSTTHDSTEEDEGRGSSRVLPPKQVLIFLAPTLSSPRFPWWLSHSSGRCPHCSQSPAPNSVRPQICRFYLQISINASAICTPPPLTPSQSPLTATTPNTTPFQTTTPLR